MDHLFVFDTTITHAHVFKPFEVYVGRDEGQVKRWSITVPHTDVPAALMDISRAARGVDRSLFKANHVPAVLPKAGPLNIVTLLQCCDYAQLNRDDLLLGTPVKVAVRMISNHCFLSAIEVDVEAMTNRYDELCAQFFTGL